MPQIDNTTFFPQVLNSFLLFLVFFIIVLKSISLLVASLLKIRLRLLSIVTYEYSFKPFIKYIQFKYCSDFYSISKLSLLLKPLFLKINK
jgi:hypothetical protein